MSRTILILFCIMLLACGLLYTSTVNTTESGPIEGAQNAILIISIYAWLCLYQRLKRMGSQAEFHPLFAAFFMCVLVIVLGRELTWLKVLGLSRESADQIKLVVLFILSGVLSWMLYTWMFNVSQRRRKIKTFLASKTSFYAIAALVFVLLGDIFEKELLPVSEPQFFEEILELTGYVLILLASLQYIKRPSISAKSSCNLSAEQKG